MISFLRPNLSKAVFTLISSLILSQLIPAVGLTEIPATQTRFSGSVYIVNPATRRVYYQLVPLYWLPAHLVYRFHPQPLDLSPVVFSSIPYWVMISYLMACVVFELPGIIRAHRELIITRRKHDPFSG